MVGQSKKTCCFQLFLTDEETKEAVMKKTVISFLLMIAVTVCLFGCGLLSGLSGDSVKSLQRTVAQGDPADSVVSQKQLIALFKLREKDKAACAESAYKYLTGFDYRYIALLHFQISADENLSSRDIMSEFFTLCEENGYPDVREAVAERVCETADERFYDTTARSICGYSPSFFELFLPRMLHAGWFTAEEGDPWADYAVSDMCSTYLENAGGELPARLAFISKEVIPITGMLTEFEPIPWKEEVPESDSPVQPGKAGACMVISRASGSSGRDHDWQIELPIYFCLPLENQLSEDGQIDTLILLDTTWQEYQEYGTGDSKTMVYSQVTNVQLINAETGVPLCEKERFVDIPGAVIMSSGSKTYHWADYTGQEDLMEFILNAV